MGASSASNIPAAVRARKFIAVSSPTESVGILPPVRTTQKRNDHRDTENDEVRATAFCISSLIPLCLCGRDRVFEAPSHRSPVTATIRRMFAYRHQFHAGGFTDVFKHALLAQLVLALRSKVKPFFYLDTHAGTGRYDLSHPWTQKNKEYHDGVARV